MSAHTHAAVIYAWDARAARLRFLAREAEVGAVGSSRLPEGRTERERDDVEVLLDDRSGAIQEPKALQQGQMSQ
jgi:hypothetical protein